MTRIPWLRVRRGFRRSFPTRSFSGSFGTRSATTRIVGVSASASAPRPRGVSRGRSASPEGH